MKDLFRTEDWWAVWVGLVVFALALGVLAGSDLLGWSVVTREWVDPGKAIAPLAKGYGQVPGPVSLLGTWAFLLAILGAGAVVMGYRLPRFLAGVSVIFGISYLCFVLGHNAYIAATPDKVEKLGISRSLGLTGEAGYILALLAGLFIGNLFPQLTEWLKPATRPEWFIKTAIVIMGASLGYKAAAAPELAGKILTRGFAAIIEAYLIYWALVYFIARKYFKFSREWAAPLASGISICGVSAAIATGAAIRARPIVPIMVSSLVVVFSVVELLLLPFLAQLFLYHEPLVAAAWMGLAVKTDGAAVASGAVTDALIRASAQKELGVVWQTDYMLMTTTTVKMFIDIFIGIWAFVLAIIWVYYIDKREGEKVRLGEIWQRFPKFVLGYFLTFGVVLVLTWQHLGDKPWLDRIAAATAQTNLYRQLFFVMTFFAIGLTSNFKKLWEEGIGRLAAVYVLSLFGFIIWIGLGISWLFFHGILPPVVEGK